MATPGAASAPAAAGPAAEPAGTVGTPAAAGSTAVAAPGPAAGGPPVAEPPPAAEHPRAPAAGAAVGVPPATEALLLERAERLRDAILRSKLTAPDPWTYTPRARLWQARAQDLVERIAREGDTAELRRALDALAAEVEGDADFQAARRLF